MSYRDTQESETLRYQIGYYRAALGEAVQVMTEVSGMKGEPRLDHAIHRLGEILARETSSFEEEVAELHNANQLNRRAHREVVRLKQQNADLRSHNQLLRDQLRTRKWADWPVYLTAIVAIVIVVLAMAR